MVKYHDIFARHRRGIGINTEFKIKLTPKHDEPVYAQSLPTPTNLKDDLLVELALMQEYGVITTLPCSKYSSPIFAQRKPNGNLTILVDLRRINHLLKNNHPYSAQPSSDDDGRRSAAHGRKAILLQTGLFTSIPQLADGRRTVSPVTRFQFRK